MKNLIFTFLLLASLLFLLNPISVFADTFYSIKDGDWKTAEIWSISPNGPPASRYPADNEDVVISHHVTHTTYSGYKFYGKVRVTSTGLFQVFTGNSNSVPYIYAGEEFWIEGTFESSSDFHHQEQGTEGDGLLYIGPAATINIGDDLILNAYGQTLMDNASCGTGTAIDDIYFVGEHAQICGNGKFVVPDAIRSWLDNGTELTNTTAKNNQVSTQMCVGFTLYGSPSDCSNDVAMVNGTGNFTFPVEWMDFSATESDKGIQLTWSTASEMNNHHFVVEKSFDEATFFELGEIDAAGNSQNVNTYNFLDRGAAESAIYYRIKQVDIDGAFSYSNVLSFQPEAHNRSIQVFPNPIKGQQMNIALKGFSHQASVVASVFDLNGRMVYEKIDTNELSGVLSLTDMNLKSGLYQLVVKSEGNTYAQKVLVE